MKHGFKLFLVLSIIVFQNILAQPNLEDNSLKTDSNNETKQKDIKLGESRENIKIEENSKEILNKKIETTKQEQKTEEPKTVNKAVTDEDKPKLIIEETKKFKILNEEPKILNETDANKIKNEKKMAQEISKESKEEMKEKPKEEPKGEIKENKVKEETKENESKKEIKENVNETKTSKEEGKKEETKENEFKKEIKEEVNETKTSEEEGKKEKNKEEEVKEETKESETKESKKEEKKEEKNNQKTKSNKKEDKELESDLPSISNISSPSKRKKELSKKRRNKQHGLNEDNSFQKIRLLDPSNDCSYSIMQTVYFPNDKKLNPHYPSKRYIHEMEKIEEPENFISFFANNHGKNKLIKKLLLKNGLKEATTTKDANLIWCECDTWSSISKYIKFPTKTYNPFQKINQLHLISAYFSLENIIDRLTKSNINYLFFIPETYILPRDLRKAKKDFSDFDIIDGIFWLVKPPKHDKFSSDKHARFLKRKRDIPTNGMIMRYIQSPLLINERKFQMKVFALITSIDPIIIYLYQDGFIFLASESYSNEIKYVDNQFIHFTSEEINKVHKDYKFNNKYNSIHGNFISIRQAKKSFEYAGVDFKKIWRKIKKAVNKSILILLPKEMKFLIGKGSNTYTLDQRNFFKIISFDFIVDSYFTPWLVGVNKCPKFIYSHKASKAISKQMIRDALNIVGINNNLNYSIKSKLSPVEQSVNEALCEFSRPYGLFKRIFPLKSNFGKFSNYFDATERDKALWKKIQDEKTKDKDEL